MPMSDRDKATVQMVRASLRPVLILMMGLGTFLLIINDADSEFAKWWMRIFFAAVAEWIIERPVIKLVKKDVFTDGGKAEHK